MRANAKSGGVMLVMIGPVLSMVAFAFVNPPIGGLLILIGLLLWAAGVLTLIYVKARLYGIRGLPLSLVLFIGLVIVTIADYISGLHAPNDGIRGLELIPLFFITFIAFAFLNIALIRNKPGSLDGFLQALRDYKD